MRVSGTLALAALNARKVVSVFRAAGATNGSKARLLVELRLNNSVTLRDLVEARVVRKAGADRYFLDEDVWAQRRRISAGTALRVALPLILALVALFLYRSGP